MVGKMGDQIGFGAGTNVVTTFGRYCLPMLCSLFTLLSVNICSLFNNAQENGKTEVDKMA